MPKYVLTDKATIPEWLYPGTWADLSTPETDSMHAPTELQLESLWLAIDSQADVRVTYVNQSYEDVGIPHNCPDVHRVNPLILDSLTTVPRHERYLVIQKWLGNINAEKLARMKTRFNKFCELASRATKSGKMIVVLPDEYQVLKHGDDNAMPAIETR